jgi:oligopeptide/dipeptide ABC transporter ATP-binding protein
MCSIDARKSIQDLKEMENIASHASSIRNDLALEARHLHVYFPPGRSFFRRGRRFVHAVDGVSLGVRKGETLAVVGESGSGKTTLCRALVGLIRATSGTVLYKGENINTFLKGEAIALGGKVQMVFQDPDSSLNPFMKIGAIVSEPISRRDKDEEGMKEETTRILELVGLGGEYNERRPDQLSGGQKQRASLARAIISKPDVVILDEPTSSLDVAVQSQILNLLVDLQKMYEMGYVLVTHNIAVAHYLSDRLAVMYAGRILEMGPTGEVVSHPLHPYTKTLMEATPVPDPKVRNLLMINVGGEPPSAVSPPSGCRFHPRCPYAKERCAVEEPLLRDIRGRLVACHFAEEIDEPGISR